MNWNAVGSYSFVLGLVIAGLIAIFSASSVPTWAIFLLAILGLIVGLLNVTDSEASSFLLAGIAFALSFNSLATIASSLPGVGLWVSSFFSLMVVFVSPAIAVVALKVLYDITKDQ